jgi:hypothetical protein
LVKNIVNSDQKRVLIYGAGSAGALKIANTNSKSLLGKYHSPNRTENAICGKLQVLCRLIIIAK